MSVLALIPAAGMGRRMGASINKQYLSLADRPILAHTLELFEAHPLIDQILVVAPQEEIPFCRREVVERYGFAKVVEIVAGGEERQDSVRHGLLAWEGQEEDLVLIHDGVRPFVPPQAISSVIAETEKVGAALLGVPVKDTIKEVADGQVVGTPERSRLWQAQTPQAFRYGLIREAHLKARAQGWSGTDDASLVEWLGQPVSMVEGNYRNIKITTPEDLVLAQAFLDSSGEIPL